jgi:hypothetical protein
MVHVRELWRAPGRFNSYPFPIYFPQGASTLSAIQETNQLDVNCQSKKYFSLDI